MGISVCNTPLKVNLKETLENKKLKEQIKKDKEYFKTDSFLRLVDGRTKNFNIFTFNNIFTFTCYR